MCGKKELFSDMEEIKGNVSLGDSTKLDVQGKLKFYEKMTRQHS
jgi:hypothetical protein